MSISLRPFVATDAATTLQVFPRAVRTTAAAAQGYLDVLYVDPAYERRGVGQVKTT